MHLVTTIHEFVVDNKIPQTVPIVQLLKHTSIQVQAPGAALVNNSYCFLSICSSILHLQIKNQLQFEYHACMIKSKTKINQGKSYRVCISIPAGTLRTLIHMYKELLIRNEYDKNIVPSSTCHRMLGLQGQKVHRRQSNHTFCAMTRACLHPKWHKIHQLRLSPSYVAQVGMTETWLSHWQHFEQRPELD